MKMIKHLRSFGALMLAAAIIAGSVFAVAAAVNTETKTKTEGAAANVMELANGDIIYTRVDGSGLSSGFIKAFDVSVLYGGQLGTVSLTGGTVADVLERMDITLAPNEVCEPALTDEVSENMLIEVYKGNRISVTADGKTEEVFVRSGNVCEVLNELGYDISDDDILNVDRDSSIEDGGAIVINRVTWKNETETTSVDFDSVKKMSDDVELGETKLSSKGEKGEAVVTKRCKYVDGKKVSEKTIDTEITKQPVDRVTLIGTKGASVSNPAGTFTDMYGNTVAYSSVYTGSGTAYTASAGALTATGVAAYHGGVAVNPNIIPYGSKLYIVSTDGSFVYGYATAVDTGGALMSGTAIVDCFYDTYDECVSFGRRDVNVYVVG